MEAPSNPLTIHQLIRLKEDAYDIDIGQDNNNSIKFHMILANIFVDTL